MAVTATVPNPALPVTVASGISPARPRHHVCGPLAPLSRVARLGGPAATPHIPFEPVRQSTHSMTNLRQEVGKRHDR